MELGLNVSVIQSSRSTLTTRLCSVVLVQADVNLHERDVLDLNLQSKGGLENNVERRCVEYADVT